VEGQLVSRRGEVVPTPEEIDVFRAIGCAIVPPEHRTDGTVLQTYRWT
jgi:DNA polymerase/3'-5' exonuclease PolX